MESVIERIDEKLRDKTTQVTDISPEEGRKILKNLNVGTKEFNNQIGKTPTTAMINQDLMNVRIAKFENNKVLEGFSKGSTKESLFFTMNSLAGDKKSVNTALASRYDEIAGDLSEAKEQVGLLMLANRDKSGSIISNSIYLGRTDDQGVVRPIQKLIESAVNADDILRYDQKGTTKLAQTTVASVNKYATVYGDLSAITESHFMTRILPNIFEDENFLGIINGEKKVKSSVINGLMNEEKNLALYEDNNSVFKSNRVIRDSILDPNGKFFKKGYRTNYKEVESVVYPSISRKGFDFIGEQNFKNKVFTEREIKAEVFERVKNKIKNDMENLDIKNKTIRNKLSENMEKEINNILDNIQPDSFKGGRAEVGEFLIGEINNKFDFQTQLIEATKQINSSMYLTPGERKILKDKSSSSLIELNTDKNRQTTAAFSSYIDEDKFNKINKGKGSIDLAYGANITNGFDKMEIISSDNGYVLTVPVMIDDVKDGRNIKRYEKISVPLDMSETEFRKQLFQRNTINDLETPARIAAEINNYNKENLRTTVVSNATGKHKTGKESKSYVTKKTAEKYIGEKGDINSFYKIMRNEDVIRAGVYTTQTSLAKGSTSTLPEDMTRPFGYLSGPRQPSYQQANTLFEFEVGGESYMEQYSKNQIGKGKGFYESKFLSNNQILIEEALNDYSSIERKNKLNKFSTMGLFFKSNSAATWEENAAITKDLSNAMIHQKAKALKVNFNDINYQYFGFSNLDEFKQSVLQNHDDFYIKQILNPELVKKKEFLEQNKNNLLNINPKEALIMANKENEVEVLNSAMVKTSANNKIKSDGGILYDDFEITNEGFKLNLKNVKQTKHGSKINFNGTKSTVENVWDFIRVNGVNVLGMYNGKDERRAQMGSEFYDVLRTSLVHLDNAGEDELNSFLQNKDIRKIMRALKFDIDSENKVIVENMYGRYGMDVNALIDSAKNKLNNPASIVKENMSKKNGPLEILEKTFGKVLIKGESKEVGFGGVINAIINAYENSFEDSSKAPKLYVSGASIQMKAGKEVVESIDSGLLLFATPGTPAVNESKKALEAVKLDTSSVRLLREKGNEVYATSLEKMIALQAKKNVTMTNAFLSPKMISDLNDKKVDMEGINEHLLESFTKDGENLKIIKEGLKESDETIEQINHLSQKGNGRINFSDFINKTKIGKFLNEGSYDSWNKKINNSANILLKNDDMDNAFLKMFNKVYGKENPINKMLDGASIEHTLKMTKAEEYIENLERLKTKREISAESFSKIKKEFITGYRDSSNKKNYILKNINKIKEASFKKGFENTVIDMLENNPMNLYKLKNAIDGNGTFNFINFSELDVDSKGNIINNQATDMASKFYRALDNFKDVKEITDYEDFEDVFRYIGRESSKFNNYFGLMNDNSTMENIVKRKGTFENNLLSYRPKNSITAAPADGSMLIKNISQKLDKAKMQKGGFKKFKKELSEILGSDIVDSILDEDLTSKALEERLHKLSDITLVNKQTLDRSLKKNLINHKGFQQIYGKYVGFPIQGFGNISSSRMIVVDSNSINKDNFFYEMFDNNSHFSKESNSSSIIMFGKKTWSKARRDFDGDKSLFIFNFLEEGANKSDNFKTDLYDKYEFLVKNKLFNKNKKSHSKILKVLDIEDKHERIKKGLEFYERIYENRVIKSESKHTYSMDEFINFFGEISEGNYKDEEELLYKIKRMDFTNHFTRENIDEAYNSLTGITGAGVVHYETTMLRKMLGSIAYGDIEIEDGILSNKRKSELISKMKGIQEELKRSNIYTSALFDTMIEEGAISAKHWIIGEKNPFTNLNNIFRKRISNKGYGNQIENLVSILNSDQKGALLSTLKNSIESGNINNIKIDGKKINKNLVQQIHDISNFVTDKIEGADITKELGTLAVEDNLRTTLESLFSVKKIAEAKDVIVEIERNKLMNSGMDKKEVDKIINKKFNNIYTIKKNISQNLDRGNAFFTNNVKDGFDKLNKAFEDNKETLFGKTPFLKHFEYYKQENQEIVEDFLIKRSQKISEEVNEIALKREELLKNVSESEKGEFKNNLNEVGDNLKSQKIKEIEKTIIDNEIEKTELKKQLEQANQKINESNYDIKDKKKINSLEKEVQKLKSKIEELNLKNNTNIEEGRKLTEEFLENTNKFDSKLKKLYNTTEGTVNKILKTNPKMVKLGIGGLVLGAFFSLINRSQPIIEGSIMEEDLKNKSLNDSLNQGFEIKKH